MPDAPWLHIVGIGEDGLDGLTPAARTVVETAEVIVGGERHHGLADTVTAERLAWPSPFDALIDTLTALRGKRVVVLATGDPLWFSVGARIGRAPFALTRPNEKGDGSHRERKRQLSFTGVFFEAMP